MYRYEQELVEDFTRHLISGTTPWGRLRVAHEFAFQSGQTDVIALCEDGRMLAFEAKLTNWRRAVMQAFGGAGFAHQSYVVMPADPPPVVLRNELLFRRREVGLVLVGPSAIEIRIEAPVATPLLPWLSRRAHDAIMKGDNDELAAIAV